MMKFTKKVLPNGLRVITVPMKDNPTATVLVLVEAGSKYETKMINGISHFLEHMCFKGTVKRPKAIDISKELDALGSQYNAFTAKNLPVIMPNRMPNTSNRFLILFRIFILILLFRKLKCRGKRVSSLKK